MKSKKARIWSPPKLAVLLLIAIVAAVPALLFTGSVTVDVLLLAGLFGAAVAADQLLNRRDCNKNGGPVAASTILYQGTLAFWNASGYVDDDTALGVNRFAGIVDARVDNSAGSAGDKDTDLVTEGQFLLNGTFVQGDVGKPAFATNNNDVTVTPTDSAVYIGTVAAYHSSTKAFIRIDTEESRIGVLSEAFVVGDFTDGGGATGHVDFAGTIPAGCIPVAWKAVVGTGFTGDTTAVAQVGVAGDVDRFSAVTTPSVLAAATVGASALGRAESLNGIGAAVTPRVTVTGGADFTSIAAGAMTVSIYYLRP